MGNFFKTLLFSSILLSSCGYGPPSKPKIAKAKQEEIMRSKKELAEEYNKYLKSSKDLKDASSNVTQNIQQESEDEKKLQELIANAPILETDDAVPTKTFFGSVNLAVLTPITGSQKKLGKEMIDSIVLSLDLIDINTINTTYIDTQSTEEGLREAMKKIKNEKYDAILGPVFSSDTAIVLKAAKDEGINIPILSLSNDKNLSDKNLLLFGYMSEDSLRDVASICSAAKKTNFATLFQGSISGSQDFKSFKAAAKDYGINIIRSEFYDTSGAIGIQKYISRILNDLTRVRIFDKKTNKELDRNHVLFNEKFHVKKTTIVDVIYLNGYGSELRKMLTAIDDQSKTIKDSTLIIVNSAAADDSVQANPYLYNTYFIGNDSYYNYVDTFYQKYSYKPSKISSILYDAIVFASSAKGELTKIDLEQIRTSKKIFEGINGQFEVSGGYIRRFGKLMKFKESGGYKLVNLDEVNLKENTEYDLTKILQNK